MSDRKWTPGPWFVGAQNDALFIIDKPPSPSNDYPNHEREVAVIGKIYDGPHGQPNAAITAAAPEMYEALHNLCAEYSGRFEDKTCGHAYPCTCTWDNAKAALKKARGEQ